MIYDPINASWLITNQCNFACNFCFMVPDRSPVSYNAAKKILYNLSSGGLKKISFAGGEPLLYPKIENLIFEAKRLGLITMLITNGSLLSENRLKALEKDLDWLCLPLEGSDDELNIKMGRPKGHFENVVKYLDFCEDLDIKTKVNTVVGKPNYKHVGKLINTLMKYNVNRWKLFQFFPIRFKSRKYRNYYELSDTYFTKIKEEILGKLENSDIIFSIESNKELRRSYISVAPDGWVYVSNEHEDIYVGDLKIKNLYEIWNSDEFDKKLFSERNKWLLSELKEQ